MGNYKNNLKITISGVERFTQGNDKLLHLTEQTQGSSTADAMQKGSSVYQVATGKTFVLVGVKIWTDATGGGTVAIYQADTEDATTSIKRTIDVPFVPNGMGMEQAIDTGVTVASGKFITIVPSTTTVLHFEIIGHERD